MAFRGKPSITKRQKELARKEHQKEKAERRARRHAEHAQGLADDSVPEHGNNLEEQPAPGTSIEALKKPV